MTCSWTSSPAEVETTARLRTAASKGPSLWRRMRPAGSIVAGVRSSARGRRHSQDVTVELEQDSAAVCDRKQNWPAAIMAPANENHERANGESDGVNVSLEASTTHWCGSQGQTSRDLIVS